MAKSIERGLWELYRDDPEKADRLLLGADARLGRRQILTGAGAAALGGLVGATVPFGRNFQSGVMPAALADEAASVVVDGKDGLTLLNDKPLNMETPAHLLDPHITPVDKFFVRNNGLLPETIGEADQWKLAIDGEVNDPLEITLGDLKSSFEVVTREGQLECGGNGRSFFDPPVRGNQWGLGAIGNGSWTGVRLKDVLARVGVKDSAVYTAHYSADIHLSYDDTKRPISRGVPIEKAMDDTVLLVWAMNGEPLPLLHGAPLRLLVPGWTGSCSQKWLNRIQIRDQVHDGAKMTGFSYRLPKYPVAPGTEVPKDDMAIMTAMIVKSLITTPQTKTQTALAEPLQVRGHAWAGDAAVSRLDVSIDFGATWSPAALAPAANQGGWQSWETAIQFPIAGYYEVWARATDEHGRAQPALVPGWNPKGYQNNAQHRVAVTVV
jgi:DMSO/TMAO reductase YedYZ molybdopterin-dependent catalytic subunit